MRKVFNTKHGRQAMKRAGAFILTGVLTASAAFALNGSSNVNAKEQALSDARLNIPGTTTTQSKYNDSFLSVTGFASIEGNINDRSSYIGTDAYRTVSTAREFLDAIIDAQSDKVKVIEITEDMNLGYNELNLSSDEKKKYSMVAKYGNPWNDLTKVNGGFTNPLMLESGVTKISFSNIHGLTIFSKNGKSIKHTEIKLNSSCSDIVIRNLEFKEMWQWDDSGQQKEVGWSNLKVNGANNVWIDHCSFEMASDGNIDMENGSSGITISWCEIGIDATETPDEGSSIYQSITFMEDRYQKGELNPDTSLYCQFRDGGATPGQIMAYSAYHKKCHLTGSGDKDYVNYETPDGDIIEDANSNLQLTLAYNHYSNCGQRVPMIRQGVGNLINCYMDNSTHAAAEAKNPIFEAIGPYHLSRCLNSRNGACIAADTCVFNGIEEPITGSEVQGDDLANMKAPWSHLFKNVYNHVLIANSKVTNSQGTFTGSSWDNNGENLFTTGFHWIDKSTLGKWAWASSIDNKDSYSKSNPPTVDDEPFTFTYDTEGKLPFNYQVLPLEDVQAVVTDKSGCGVVEMSSEEWCKTAYLADADYSAVDAAIAKANSLNKADYVDFSAVTAAINAVQTGLKSDKQASVTSMATAIENAIQSLVKVAVETPTTDPKPEQKPTVEQKPTDNQKPTVSENPSVQDPTMQNPAVQDPSAANEADTTTPKTADHSMVIFYALLIALSTGLAGTIAVQNKRRKLNK